MYQTSWQSDRQLWRNVSPNHKCGLCGSPINLSQQNIYPLGIMYACGTFVLVYLINVKIMTFWRHSMESQGITKTIWVHPLGNMNLGTKFHGKPSVSRYWTVPIIVGTTVTTVDRIHPLGTMNASISLLYVEMFHKISKNFAGSAWWEVKGEQQSLGLSSGDQECV